MKTRGWTVALILLMLLALQWVRSERERQRLEIELSVVQRDLEVIEKSRTKLSEIQEMQVAELDIIEALQRRIPVEPMANAFLHNLQQRLQAHDIGVSLQALATRHRDFYDEIHLTVALSRTVEKPDILLASLRESERYVFWDNAGQAVYTTLEVTIYATSMELEEPAEAAHRPCTANRTAALSYWPFSSGVRSRIEHFTRICAEREGGADILAEASELQNIRRYRVQLEALATELNPEKPNTDANHEVKPVIPADS